MVVVAAQVSLLLKESFVESFPRVYRVFMRMFVETQMFTAYSDYLLTKIDKLHNHTDLSAGVVSP